MVEVENLSAKKTKTKGFTIRKALFVTDTYKSGEVDQSDNSKKKTVMKAILFIADTLK